MKIFLNMGQCEKCKQVLVSLSVHDYRACKCGNAVDGGTDYLRRVGDIKDMTIIHHDGGLFFREDVHESTG